MYVALLSVKEVCKILQKDHKELRIGTLLSIIRYIIKVKGAIIYEWGEKVHFKENKVTKPNTAVSCSFNNDHKPASTCAGKE